MSDAAHARKGLVSPKSRNESVYAFDEQIVGLLPDGTPSALLAREMQGSLENARAFERHARGVAQSLSGQFAWGSVAWFSGVLAGWGLVSWLTLAGHLSYWAAVPINAILIYGIFATLHEATHDNIAGRHRGLFWFNELIGHVSGYVLLAPYIGFRALHLHHHQHTNDPVEDPDYWVKDNNYLRVILRCMVIQPIYVWHLWKIARTPRIMRAFIWEIVFILSYIPVIVAAYWLGFGNELMLLWILPAYIGVVLCPLMFDWPVHHPHDNRGRYTGSAILLFPKPLRKVMEFAFLGHSYHLMHHLFPRIPFYRYGTAYYALEKELKTVNAKVVDLTFSHYPA